MTKHKRVTKKYIKEVLEDIGGWSWSGLIGDNYKMILQRHADADEIKSALTAAGINVIQVVKPAPPRTGQIVWAEFMLMEDFDAFTAAKT